MKIKRLWVSKYKNVEDLDLNFNSDLITMLVGKNGLGKSNLIEILALIFDILKDVKSEKELTDWASKNFEFDISYEVKANDIRLYVKNIAKKDSAEETIEFYGESKPTDTAEDYPFENMNFKDFLDNKKNNLPNHIIGYYSGENKRIAKIISKSEDIIRTNQKANKFEEEFRYLFFTQNHHSELLLLTLLIWSKEPYLEKFNQLIGYYLNIHEISGVEITFRSPNWEFGEKAPKEYKNTGVNFLYENYDSGMEFPFWGCKGKANKLLQFLYNSSEGVPAIYDSNEVEKKPGRPKYYEEIIFNNLNVVNLTKSLDNFFNHPIQLFDALEACLDLNILKEIKFTIRKNEINDLLVFTDLSEGEQQLLTVMALVLIIGEDDCLFLFDEPDTHLNPDWQRDYVQLLTDFNLNDDNSHIFVATLSPLIVQAGESTDIILFYRDTNGKIKTDKNFDIHNYRIDQVLASKYFGLESTRPPYLDEFMKIRSEILSKQKINKQELLQLKLLENQFGVLPTGETITELENHILIAKVAQKLKKYDKTKKG